MTLGELLAMWAAGADTAATLETHQVLAARAVALEEPLLAHDIVRAGLEHDPGDVRLRQLLALALARSGSTPRAQAVLEALERDGHTDDETLGLLARTWKDRWRHAEDPEA